jgi:hypothetical protein
VRSVTLAGFARGVVHPENTTTVVEISAISKRLRVDKVYGIK